MKDSLIKISEVSRLIMQKPKEERQPLDNSILLKNFESFPYFLSLLNSNEYGQIMYSTLINCLEFKTYSQGATIFKYKEPYSSMIVVIEGSIQVHKPPIEMKAESAKSLKAQKGLNKPIPPKDKETDSDRVLNQGEAYGANELKLLRKHPRNVEAKTNCTIGLLTLTDYSLIFEKTSLLEKMNVSRFLTSITFFSNISSSMAENLQEAMAKEVFNLGDIVISQGNPAKKVYVVRKGLFQVSLKNTRRFFNEFDMNYFEKLVKEPQRFTSSRRFELQDSYKQLIEYKLINLGPGEILCDFEYKHNSAQSYFTIQCTINNSELMSIDMNQFAMFLLPKNKIKFNKLVEEKLIFMKKRIKEIRASQLKFNIQKNKYVDAILSKMPKSKDEKKCLLKSISKEKKCYKAVVLALAKHEHQNKNDSFSLSKRFKMNCGLSMESDKNIPDDLLTHSTYITKNRLQSPPSKVSIKKGFLEGKTYQIHLEKPKTPFIAQKVLSSNFSDDSKCDNKNQKKLLWFSFAKENKERRASRLGSNSSNAFRITKRMLLKNNSSSIYFNHNPGFPCFHSAD